MQVAALYDVHGNLPALDAVLDEVARADVDRIVIGGDVVPGPMPGAEVELRRTGYDLEQAAERIRATAYPQAMEFA